MSATTTTTTTAPPTGRARVGWGDLAWLTWRQHRWTVLGTAAAVVATAALALGMALHVDATGDTHELLGEWRYLSVAQMLVLTPAPLGALIAVFWAAPLLSREYEHRTHLVVWSQDVTPLRWLAAKAVLLCATASALAGGLGLALVKLMNSLTAVNHDHAVFQPFAADPFEAAPHVQVGYAAFGFALGLLFSATTRRTVLSMGLTLAAFVAVRVAVAEFWRPRFQEPLRRVEPFWQYSANVSATRDSMFWIDGGFSDAAGNPVGHPSQCDNLHHNADYVQCTTEHDVYFFTEYHPVERLATFRLVEFAIFAVLSAGLFALAFLHVRRANRV